MKQDFTYALDKNQHLINIKDASKEIEYFCPCCGAIMIPKQGKKNRWHFAHKGSLNNCSYETYLHKLAKLRIKECFLNSPKFTIKFHPTVTCAITECPLGTINRCTWNKTQAFNLKDFYNTCTEEATIGNFRADLLLSHCDKKNREPILIEIVVTHHSTDEKIHSNHRIIEIIINSEEDINEIVSNAEICESGVFGDLNQFYSNGKIRFYNFKGNFKELPDQEHQAYKYRFWIESNGYYKRDKIDDFNDSLKCLTPNPADIENSVFLIESMESISLDFALQKLAESGLKTKYCNMCNFYRYNDKYMRSMCILYKSKGTNQFPRLSEANNCAYFKQLVHEGMVEINTQQAYRVRVHKDDI